MFVQQLAPDASHIKGGTPFGRICNCQVQEQTLCNSYRQALPISVSEKREYVLSKQILRSGTSIGANLAESEYAISKKDFLSKTYVSLKECSETLYWLELLYETDYINAKEYVSIKGDCEELRKMLSSISKTTHEKIENGMH